MFVYPEDRLNVDPNFNVNNVFFFLITSVLILRIGVQRLINRYFNIIIYGKILIFLAGTLCATLALHTPFLANLRKNSPLVPERILECVLYPALLVRLFYDLNLKRFFKCLPIIIIYSVLMVANGFLLAFLMKYLYRDLRVIEWLIIAITITTTQPKYMISFLSLNDSYKHVIICLEGESIISVLITFPIADYVMDILTHGSMPDLASTLWYFIIGHVVGAFVGWICAKILIMVMKHLVLNLESLFAILMSTALLLYVGSIQFSISGFTTGLVFALVLNPERARLLDTHKQQFKLLIDLYYQLSSDIVFFYCTTKAGCAFNSGHIDNYFYCYTLLMCLRILSVSAVYPLIKKIYKIPVLHIYLHSMVCPTSTFSLIIATQFYFKSQEHASLAFSHCLFNSCLSIFINNFFCVNILKWTHTGYISEARIANMQKILNLIKEHRDKEIAFMKLDRNYCDVNWTIVNNYAKFTMGYPYPPPKKPTDWERKERNFSTSFQDNQICCSDCPNMPDALQNSHEIKYLNHRKMIVSMIRSALKLKAKHHLLTADCEDIIFKVTDLYLGKNSDQAFAILRYNSRPQAILGWLKKISAFLCVIRMSAMPRRKFFRVFYLIRKNKIFQVLNHVLTIITILPLILKWVTSLFTNTHERYFYSVAVFFFIFEFIVTIFSNVTIKCTDGLRNYFRSFWQIMDFISTFGMTVECITLWLDRFYDYGYWVPSFGWLKYARLFRFIRFVTMFLPKVLFTLENSMQQRLETAYESVLALNDSINSVLLSLERLTRDDLDGNILNELIVDLLADKAKLQEIQIQLHTEYPLVDIVKTKIMLNGATCCIHDYLLKLKFQGFIDNNELILLKNLIMVKRSRHDAVVPLITPTALFLNNCWIATNSTASDYLHSVAVLGKWPDQHVLVKAFEPVKGVYMLIGGHLSISYRVGTTKSQYSIRYIEFENDVITQGNTFGEIEMITNRCYPYTLHCVGECRTYFITKKSMCTAMTLSNHPITGLEAVLWKRKMLRLTSEILMYEGLYQFQDLWTINKSIQKAFVPDLRCYKVFIFLDSIKDIVLLDGEVMDYHTNEIYMAPCYIPRSVRKLILPKPIMEYIEHDFFCVLTTKLMIIPLGELNPTDVLAQQETVAEMVQHDFSTCPYHVTQIKGKIQTRATAIRTSNFAMLKNMSTAIATASYDVRLPSVPERTTMRMRNRFSLKVRRQLLEEQVQ